MIKYLYNHSSTEKTIGQISSIEDLESKCIFTMIYTENVSNEFIEGSINFYKKEGMFISYDSDTRTLKYKIGSND